MPPVPQLGIPARVSRCAERAAGKFLRLMPRRSSSQAKFVAVEGLGLLCAEIGHGDCAGKERIPDIQDLYPEGHGSARCDTNGWAGEEGEP